MDFVRVPAWERYPWLRHGFSSRAGGVSTVYGTAAGREDDGPSLNLGWTKEDDPAHVAQNRSRFAQAVAGPQAPRPITLRQVHGVEIHPIYAIPPESGPFEDEQGRAILAGDGMMTDTAGVLLAIQTADCVPVLLIDPENRAVAGFHAGWRGTAAAMVEQGVARMQQQYGSRPQALLAAIGPSIGPCCYTVGDEVREAFHARFPYAAELFKDQRLDLGEANRRQLLAAGIPDRQITVVAQCTGCALTAAGHRRYFSHRIDHGVTGRMMALVGIAAG